MIWLCSIVCEVLKMFKTFQVIHFKLKLVSDQNGLCFIYNYFVKIHFKKANFFMCYEAVAKNDL